MSKSKIMILFGGCSSEYKVSLQSAYAVICNLDETRYEPVLIGIDFKGHWYLFEGNRDTIPEDTWWEQKECYPAVVSMEGAAWDHGIPQGLRERRAVVVGRCCISGPAWKKW